MGKIYHTCIVIVLSILDFIKAIGTDKDDEIKKSPAKICKKISSGSINIYSTIYNRICTRKNGI